MNNYREQCDDFMAGFVMERYVAGKLTESETIAFEEHLLECDRCQEELTLAVAVREVLSGESGDRRPRGRRLTWRRAGLGVTLAAAAAVAAILVLPRARVAGRIAELGRVTQPPIYLGVPVRLAPSRSDSVFEAAMSAYMAGDYAAATDGLRTALEAGADPASSEFFLGASLLMLGENDRAAEAFDSVIDLGDSPYLPEAHFYLAKALLKSGDVGGAVEHLEATAGQTGEVGRLSSALMDSVEALQRR